MKKIFPIALVLCIVLAWLSLFNRTYKLPNEYEKALSNVRKSCEEGYYLEAQEELNKANSLPGASSSYEADALQRDIYMNLNDSGKYISWLKTLINRYPDEVENYEKLIQAYQQENSVSMLVSVLPGFKDKWPDNEIIASADLELSGLVRTRSMGLFDVQYASGDRLIVQKSETEIDEQDNQVVRKYVAGKDGRASTSFGCSDISVSADGKSFFIRDDEGRYTLVDKNSNLIARNDDVTFDWIGELSNEGIAPAIIDGKFRFINKKMLVNDSKWDYASCFSEGFAAVKSGDKWAFAAPGKLSGIEEFPYTSIAVSSKGYPVLNKRAVVSDSTGYYILDMEKNEPVSDDRYDEIKAYESGQPVAFRKGDKWGFLSGNGQVLYEALYDDAKSYTNGYAAVKVGDKWGYVDKNCNLVIEPQFEDAMPVLSEGYAYVKDSDGYWNQIIIERLYFLE